MADEQLRWKLGADDSEARRVLSNFAKQLESLGSSVPIAGFDKLATIFRAGGPFAAVAIVIGAVTIATKALVGALDNLDETAQGVGTTAVALDELSLGAKFSGVEVEHLTKALAALNTKAADAFGGNQSARAAFDALGISVKGANGNLKPTEQLLGEISDKIKTFRDDAAKGALLADIFGQKLGPRLAAFLNQGSDALRVNTGLTQEAVDQAVRAQREIDKSTASWERLKNVLALFAAKGINAVSDFFKGFDSLDNEGKLARLTAQLETLRKTREFSTQGRRGELFDTKAIDAQIAATERSIASLEEIKKAQDKIDEGKKSAPNLVALEEARKRFDSQREALASYVDGLQKAIDATEGLTEAQKAERAIAQEPLNSLIAGNERALELMRSEAKELDDIVANAANFARLAKEQDAFATAMGKAKNFGDDLLNTILDLSGRKEETRKIILSDALDDLIPKLGLTKEEAEKAVLAIAGLGPETADTGQHIREFGATLSNTFEEALVHFDHLGDVFKSFGESVERIAIKQFLTDPINDFFRSLRSNEDLINAVRGLFGLPGLGGGGSVAGNAADFGPPTDGGLGAPTGGSLVIGQSRRGSLGSKGDGGITLVQNNTFNGGMTQAEGKAFADVIQAKTLAAVQNARQRNPAFA